MKTSVATRRKSSEKPSTQRTSLVAASLALLTLFAFANSFQSGFVLDNQGLLLDPRIRAATSYNLALIFRHTYWWPTGEAGLYRPFSTLSYLFNYAILRNRDQPGGYHALNLLLHLANVGLAWALLLRLTRKFWPSTLIAALWAVHPVQTEAVTNIAGRPDLLAATAVLSGLLIYLTRANILALALVAAIGVFSKESAVALLLVLLVLPATGVQRAQSRRRTLLALLAVSVPIAAMLFARSSVLAASRPAELPFTDNPISGGGFFTARLTAIKVMADYLRLTIWPARLSCDYSWRQIPLFDNSPEDWLAIAVVLALALTVISLYRFNRTALFLACFAFLTFLPASNLLFPTGTIMAIRLLYLPSLGLLGCLILAVDSVLRSPQSRRIAVFTLCAAVAACAIRTIVRNQDWQSDMTIASADVRVAPRSFKLHRLLASSLFASDPSRSNIDQVIAEQEQSLAILDPLPPLLNRPDAYRMAGFYYLVKSRMPGQPEKPVLYGKAIRALERAIAIDQAGRAAYQARAGSYTPPSASGDAQAYLLLSVALLESGDAAKALPPALEARAIDLLNPQIYRQLSGIFFAQGRKPESETAGAAEDSITAARREDWPRAAELSSRVLTSGAADHPVAFYISALSNLHLGKIDAAEYAAREAVRLDPARRNPAARGVLGLVLAEKQQYGQAIEMLKAYLGAAPAAPDADDIRARLAEIERLARTDSVR